MSERRARLASFLGCEERRTVVGATSGEQESGPAEPFFGCPALDRLVPGGLAADVHEFECANAAEYGLLTGFTCAVASQLALAQRNIAWISDRVAFQEAGPLYSIGFQEIGLDPERLIEISCKSSTKVLWAIEQCLASPAVGAIVGEVVDKRVFDLTTTRRLALRAKKVGRPVYLIGVGLDAPAASSAVTRWRVAGAPSGSAQPGPNFLGPPAWHLSLIKNRVGPCADTIVGYDPFHKRFEERAAQSSPAMRPVPAVAGMVSHKRVLHPTVVHLAAERRRMAAHAMERR